MDDIQSAPVRKGGGGAGVPQPVRDHQATADTWRRANRGDVDNCGDRLPR